MSDFKSEFETLIERTLLHVGALRNCVECGNRLPIRVARYDVDEYKVTHVVPAIVSICEKCDGAELEPEATQKEEQLLLDL